MSLGTNISRLRAEKRLSQGDLAEVLEVSRQSVSKWETDSSVPDLDKLIKLSQLFRVTLDELVTGAEPQLRWRRLRSWCLRQCRVGRSPGSSSSAWPFWHF